MISLSPRLAVIAGEIKAGWTVADIGTDHGFLPISLWERGIAPHVILTDVSSGALQKAAENCKRLYPAEQFDLRLGSGFSVLEMGEADAVVLAGMGGMLMTEILAADEEKAFACKRLILQPRNHIGQLRHWLYHHSFSVEREQLVREGRFICEILTAVPREVAVSRSMGPERIEYQYPRKLIEDAGPLTEEYLLRKLATEKKILHAIGEGKTPDPRQLRSQQYRIDYLNDLLTTYRKEYGGMKGEEIARCIEQRSPLTLQESWDHSGFQLCFHRREITRLLVALEITEAVIDEAERVAAEMIVTHHPLLFQPIKLIDDNDVTGNYLVRLCKAEISVYASHTPFDKCESGNNDDLGRLLHLRNLQVMTADETGFCRFGYVDGDCTALEYMEQIAQWLDLDMRSFAFVGRLTDRVFQVGLCTGAGADFIDVAKMAGCDLFITGDVKYHTAQRAKEIGLNLLDLGHFGTEKIFTANMAEYLQAALPTVEVIPSTVDLNPFSM